MKPVPNTTLRPAGCPPAVHAKVPRFESPESIFDLLNFTLCEVYSVCGSSVTRMCEAEFGITREEWQFIAMLAALGEISPSNLSTYTAVDRSQVSKTLRSLQDKQLIHRSTLSNDRRRAQLILSDSGRKLHDRLFPRVLQVHECLMADFDESERKLLARMLNKLELRATQVAEEHKPETGLGRRKGGSRATWVRPLG